MLPLLLSLLRTVEAYFGIKAVRAKWELERDIENYCDGVQNEILKARAAGDDIRADILHERLLSSSGLSVASQRDIEIASRSDLYGNKK